MPQDNIANGRPKKPSKPSADSSQAGSTGISPDAGRKAVVPAVVTPLDEHMGLDIARSLGRRSIPVYGLDPDPHAVGGLSRHCRLVVCPNPATAEADYLRFLLDWGKDLGRKAVLYPVSDTTALLCSRERRSLQRYYEFVMPEHGTMTRLASKEGLAAAALEHGVPAPRTVVPGSLNDVEKAARELAFPAILKPTESAFWHRPEIASLLRENILSGRPKVIFCRDAGELGRAYRSVAAYDNRLIIQEVIPGPEKNLAYISFCLDRQTKPLAFFAGRKLRVLPIGFGSASCVRSFRDPDLEQTALRLLSGVCYQGLGGMEFKKDSRDSRYKLIEFNVRFGLWDGLGVRCGVDTPHIAYLNALSLPAGPPPPCREGVIWVDWQRDVRAFWMYRRQGRLTLARWLRSLRGEKMWAIYSRSDWRPGLAFTVRLVRNFLGRLLSGSRPRAAKG